MKNNRRQLPLGGKGGGGFKTFRVTQELQLITNLKKKEEIRCQ